MNVKAIYICRAAGLMGWTADVHMEDGRRALDLDIQARDLPDAIYQARKEYPGVEPEVDADPYWWRKRWGAWIEHYGIKIRQNEQEGDEA